jgi:hypothetical protein
VRYYGVGIGGERGQMGAQRASGGRVCEQFFFEYAQIKKKSLRSGYSRKRTLRVRNALARPEPSIFLGSHGTLVAVLAPFMMPPRDSDIPMNVPFTIRNKQPLTHCQI